MYLFHGLLFFVSLLLLLWAVDSVWALPKDRTWFTKLFTRLMEPSKATLMRRQSIAAAKTHLEDQWRVAEKRYVDKIQRYSELGYRTAPIDAHDVKLFQKGNPGYKWAKQHGFMLEGVVPGNLANDHEFYRALNPTIEW